ncbi:MAG: aminotransferase class III-fold pyridoxal phosphate-dependent enzyme [Actinobacteria bacterium]|nr:aminotransferase class III-fold pyridoxal phosphate-dependent enzyme [Actinomycetota bacterium]
MLVPSPTSSSSDLIALGQRHLWGHFTNLSAVQRQGLPVIVRGDGPHVFDADGKRYLDGLSGLFTVNIGHGRTELAAAAEKQSRELAYFPLWSFGHEPGIRLAAIGQPERRKVISRDYAYHGTTLGALSMSSAATTRTTAPPWAPSASPASPPSANPSNHCFPGP